MPSVGFQRALPFALLALAFAIRVAYVFAFPLSAAIGSDMQAYLEIAIEISTGQWSDRHFFQPVGLPLVMVAMHRLFADWALALSLLQAALSTATLALLWLTVRRAFGEKLALASLALGAFHAPWIAYTGLALAETIYTFFLALLAYLTAPLWETRKPSTALAWGAAFAVAFWFKSTHVLLLPLLSAGLLLSRRNSKPCPAMAAIAAPFVVSLLLHGALTRTTIGRFQLTPSAGGFNLVEGKCPVKHNIDNEGRGWMSPLYYQLGYTEEKRWGHRATDSAAFTREGLKCIAADPRVLIESLENIPFLFFGNYLWPVNKLPWAWLGRLYELYFAAFAVAGLAAFAVSRRRERESAWIWLTPLVALFLCVYIFKSEIRFRIPFDLWVIPLAFRGWQLMLAALRGGSPTPNDHR